MDSFHSGEILNYNDDTLRGVCLEISINTIDYWGFN